MLYEEQVVLDHVERDHRDAHEGGHTGDDEQVVPDHVERDHRDVHEGGHHAGDDEQDHVERDHPDAHEDLRDDKTAITLRPEFQGHENRDIDTRHLISTKIIRRNYLDMMQCTPTSIYSLLQGEL